MRLAPAHGGHGRGSRVPPRAAAAAVVAALAALGGCSSGSAERPAAPKPAPVVTVDMLDYRFVLDRSVPAGRVVFRIRNRGEVPHHLTMLPLPEDVPPIAEQLRGTQRRVVEPYAGIYERQPGDTGTFAVDLAPGRRYALICSLQDEDGQPHWRKGMATEFRTSGTPAEGATTTTAAPADGATPTAGTTPTPAAGETATTGTTPAPAAGATATTGTTTTTAPPAPVG